MIVSDVTYSEQVTQTTEQSDQLGREAFLTLLLAQLAHQDPLSPMDSMEFTAQLSQFSELEQMVGINEKLDNLLLYQSSLNSWQGVGMIDREVDALGDWVVLEDGAPGAVGYELGEASSQVTVKIFDEAGNLVRTLQEIPHDSGKHLIGWDGKGDHGVTLPDGRYAVTVLAGTEESGQGVTTFVRGVVTGVSFEDQIPLLLMGDERVPFASIMEIRDIPKG